MGRRRRKPAKVSLSDDSGSSSSDEDEGEDDKRERKKERRAGDVIDVSNETVQRPCNVGNCASEIVPPVAVAQEDGNRNHYDEGGPHDDDDDDDPPPNEEAFLRQAPFCCSRCRCPKRLRKRLKEDDNRYFLPGDNAPWHRICCHGHHTTGSLDRPEHWSTPFLAAQEKVEEHLISGICEGKAENANAERDGAQPPPTADPASNVLRVPKTFSAPMEWITKREIKSAYDEAIRQQASVYNDDSLESKCFVLFVDVLFPVSSREKK